MTPAPVATGIAFAIAADESLSACESQTLLRPAARFLLPSSFAQIAPTGRFGIFFEYGITGVIDRSYLPLRTV
jgi:hypothetical protein